ncbi:hypothetical protein M9H77_27261 [Catharanthus roseus]|uniref:Uncharacterized protein n=1 Tax=Catharanthus roseus TaxID=4058 RepID=A0ACC0ABZ9_CATRO|nr:hypothetical protein M9H77_27261 [Catharanthus roseus]
MADNVVAGHEIIYANKSNRACICNVLSWQWRLCKGSGGLWSKAGWMIYLDSDIQVFENIDHLFDLPKGSFYAVMDCFFFFYEHGLTLHNTQNGLLSTNPRKSSMAYF